MLRELYRVHCICPDIYRSLTVVLQLISGAFEYSVLVVYRGNL